MQFSDTLGWCIEKERVESTDWEQRNNFVKNNAFCQTILKLLT